MRSELRRAVSSGLNYSSARSMTDWFSNRPPREVTPAAPRCRSSRSHRAGLEAGLWETRRGHRHRPLPSTQGARARNGKTDGCLMTANLHGVRRARWPTAHPVIDRRRPCRRIPDSVLPPSWDHARPCPKGRRRRGTTSADRRGTGTTLVSRAAGTARRCAESTGFPGRISITSGRYDNFASSRRRCRDDWLESAQPTRSLRDESLCRGFR